MDPKQHFLLIHNDYHTTWIGLFCGLLCIDKASCPNKHISKSLFIVIDELLQKNDLVLNECAFLAVNQGPGPFTTLRVIIASLNGLSFATQLPLIGVNCIKTLTYEYADTQYDYIIALANAFCNDFYYGILDTKKESYIQGCISCEQMLAHLQSISSSSFKCVGYVSDEQKHKCIELVPNNELRMHSYFEDPSSQTASLEAMGKQAYQQWVQQENVVTQLLPLYFKSLAPIMGTPTKEISS